MRRRNRFTLAAGASAVGCALAFHTLILRFALSSLALLDGAEFARAGPAELPAPTRPGEQVGRTRGAAGIAACFSPDGKRLLTAGGDSFVIWDVDTQRALIGPLRHPDRAELLIARLSPDGRRALTVAGDTAKLWELDGTGRIVYSWRHSGTIRAASFNRTGSRVCTGGDDGVARVWNTVSGELVAERSHPNPVRFAEFSPNGERLLTIVWGNATISGGSHAAAYLWDKDTGRDVVPPWAVDQWVPKGRDTSASELNRVWQRRGAFSPDSTRVATTIDGNVVFTHCGTGRVVGRVELGDPYGYAGALAFSPDGKKLAIAGGGAGGDHVVGIVDAETNKLVRELEHSYETREPAFAPDSRLLLLAGRQPTYELNGRRAVLERPVQRLTPNSSGVWEIATGRQLYRVPPGGDHSSDEEIPVVAWNSDATMVAVGSAKDGETQLWRIPQ